MNRIMIIGCGGAGKSTLARRIHQITKIPLVHLDRQYWSANWVETSKPDWEQKVRTLVEADRWIMDGNYGGTMDIRLQAADTVIFMDRSRWLCLFRVIKRVSWYYGRSRPDMAEGCNERFSWDFLKYIYHYNRTRRPAILKKLKELPEDTRVYVLQKEWEVDQLLATFTQVSNKTS